MATTTDSEGNDKEWAALLHRLLDRKVPSVINEAVQPAATPQHRDDDANISTDNKSQQPKNKPRPISPIPPQAKPSLQTLPPDNISLILSHLHPYELFNFSITSKRGNDSFNNELLWRYKFVDRWNCPDLESQADMDKCYDDANDLKLREQNGFWKQAYQSAYRNTHDLWIRHWDCTFPEDVSTVSGRTVIPPIRRRIRHMHSDENQQTMLQRSYKSSSLNLCPTCRYHPMLQNGYNADVLKAVRDELEYAKREKAAAAAEEIEQDDDPVFESEVVAAAHSLLANKQSAYDMNYPSVGSTAARAINYSTMYSIAKWCRNVRLDDGSDSSLLHKFHEKLCRDISVPSNSQILQQAIRDKAIHAFESASTYNRRIDTKQYNSSGLHFLTDALFFNIHPSHEQDRTCSASWRSKLRLPDTANDTEKRKYGTHLDDILQDLNQENAHESSPFSLSELGPRYETSHHSWHVVRLTNPDYVRPITFRAYIQCSNAFTIFPSQGYLKGGETVYLVLGVRTYGSLLNEAFEAVNIEREQADPSLLYLYKNKGHLPFVPFVIRYLFAPCLPCTPHDYEPRFDNQFRNIFAPTNPQSMPDKFQTVVDHLWNNVTVEANVRTIPISCHVNSNYSLDQFQNATLMPIDLPRQKISGYRLKTPLATMMPQLMEKGKTLFAMIQNLDLELESSHAGDVYRTEKNCCHCNRDWGPQSEILGRAYILRRLNVEWHMLVRSKQQSDFFKTLNAIPLMLKKTLLDDDNSATAPSRSLLSRLHRICQLVYLMQTDFLAQRRADNLLFPDQEALSSCDQYLDGTYADIQHCIRIIESDTTRTNLYSSFDRPWRKRGVYVNPKCSDWVAFDRCGVSNDSIFKPEPKNLEKFGLVEQSAGGFSFGRQDDPNHEESQTYKNQPPIHTDMFHNNAVEGFMSALAMIGKPESLVGHGIYDRVANQGHLMRCPSQPCQLYFRTSQMRSHSKLTQKALDLVKEWALERTNLAPRQRTCYSNVYWKSINFEFNDQDPDGLNLVAFGLNDFATNFQTTMGHFISNVPLPGEGSCLLSTPPGNYKEDIGIISIYTHVKPYSKIIFPSTCVQNNHNSQTMTDSNSSGVINDENQEHQQIPRVEQNGIAELNIVWLIARHLGWTVDDDRSRGAILVDRRILIAVQWLSNTIMVFSLLGSLLSRKFKLVKSIPADFHFFGGPIKIIHSDMRFWSAEECGFAALLVFGFYFILGRMSERNVSRTYYRELSDRFGDRAPQNSWLVSKATWHASQWVQRLYDSMCPWMIQRFFFVPRWSNRSREEILNSISHQRSIDFREHRSSFNAASGRGCMEINISSKLGFWSYTIGLSFALVSFSACSPHFVVNSLTVFCCSLAFGLSMSVESLENIRRTTSRGVLSMVKPRRLNTLVIGHILIGQLVGGSGGIMFLAEFVVASICLILGGAASITSRSVESWITFVCLASTAFWGFVFARLGLLDAVRKRRRGIPSALLCASLCSSFCMWIGVFTRVDWQALTPGDLVLIQMHHLITEIRDRWRSYGWGSSGT